MACVNLNISMARDGDDFILVFRNCTPELEDIIKGLMATMAKGTAAKEPAAELKDDPEEKKVPKLTKGPYRGMTPKELLNQTGVSGITELLMVQDEPEDVMEDIKKALNEYPYTYFKDVDPDKYTEGWGIKEIRQFMDIFEPLVPQTWRNEIALKYGAEDYETAKKSMTAKMAIDMIVSFIGYWK